MPEPEILLVGQGSDISRTRTSSHKHEPKMSDLTDLDMRTIWALHRDARRSVSDVAADIGVSSKTVIRRLARMMKKDLIDFHALAFPNLDEDLQILIKVRLSLGASRPELFF